MLRKTKESAAASRSVCRTGKMLLGYAALLNMNEYAALTRLYRDMLRAANGREKATAEARRGRSKAGTAILSTRRRWARRRGCP